jgi:predicted nuclease with TOPRIM domain
MLELQGEISSLSSKDDKGGYSISDILPEDDGEIAESLENVARLEKQNAVLKEKNKILVKTNQEYKKRLEALTKGINTIFISNIYFVQEVKNTLWMSMLPYLKMILLILVW